MLMRVDGCTGGIGPAGRGVVDGWQLLSLSSDQCMVVTLRDGARDAAAPGDYLVTRDETASSPAASPRAAALVWFPDTSGWARTPSGSTPYWPTFRQMHGWVRLLAGTAVDRSALVLMLATSTRAIDDACRTSRRTPLPPGQDPALLATPDRVAFCAVTAQILVPTAAGCAR